MSLSNKAFVMAAGLGVRMRPLTENCPKSLLEVGGQPMIDRALDSLAAFGIETAVVNTHYLGSQIADHLAGRTTPEIILSHEEELLGRGGGVKKMLAEFNGEPFFCLASDMVWTDNEVPALRRLADDWDSEKMDFLHLLQPLEKSHGYVGLGDYFRAEDGRLTRRLTDEKPADYMFTSLRIVHPRVFDGKPDGNFDILQMYDEAEANGRLFGVVHDGEWFHMTTPEDFEQTNKLFKERAAA